ncbi:MAG: hypothetical protein J0M20_09675 [Burkholderiales bacterium]|nr:hypothetical protein [Burkholderiales bacterium]
MMQSSQAGASPRESRAPEDNQEPTSQRRSLEISDLRLSFGAVQWIQSFDIDHRPIELALRFPRLANLLSGLWSDAPAALAVLDDLLTDHRGGRTGFPEAVRLELMVLRSRLGGTA